MAAFEETPPVVWISALAWKTRRDARRFDGLYDANGPTGALDDAELWPQQRLEALVEARLRAALQATPSIGAFWQAPTWPVCCEQLSVLACANPLQPELAALEQAHGAWDDAALNPDEARVDWKAELATIRGGGRAENGVNLFRCAKCGGRTGVYSHT